MVKQDGSIFEDTQLGVLGELFLGTSTAKILDFLLIYREYDYSESEIARGAGISIRHIYRAIPKLEHLGLVEFRTSGRAKMYKINSNSETIQHLEKFIYSIAETKMHADNQSVKCQSVLDEVDAEKLIAE